LLDGVGDLLGKQINRVFVEDQHVPFVIAVVVIEAIVGAVDGCC
jgi:hypothetical protein